MTKAYKRGRTESIRTAQPEAAKFVETFCSEAPDKDKVAALRKACATHSKVTKECSQGMGQDRVLYAMLCVHNHENGPEVTPDFYKDPGFSKLGSSVLSTSNCGNPALRYRSSRPLATAKKKNSLADKSGGSQIVWLRSCVSTA